MMKSKIPLTLGLLAFTAGCVDHEKIVFSDEADIRTDTSASVVAQPAPKHLEKADELKIEQLIFGYLLEGHFWDAGDYTAVFIQADDSQVDALIKKYPNHVPPIKQSDHALVQAHHTPMDKDTNRSAMILSADVNEPNADDSVDAIGRWYAGDAVTGFHQFHLIKLNDDWQIAEVK
jgi:hypothetical protein